MSPPPRCFSCGTVVGDKWETYVMLLQQGKTDHEATQSLGLKKWCCKRMLYTHMSMIDLLLVRRKIEGKGIGNSVDCSTGDRGDGREDCDDGGGDD